MSLDPEQLQAVVEWHSLYLRGCLVCQCRDYVIEGVVAMPELGPSGPSLTRGLPAVPIVCRNCGHIIFVSATALKFIQAAEPTSEVPAAGQDAPREPREERQP
jgi:hypothetical protein